MDLKITLYNQLERWEKISAEKRFVSDWNGWRAHRFRRRKSPFSEPVPGAQWCPGGYHSNSGGSRASEPFSPFCSGLLSTPLFGRLFWQLNPFMNGKHWTAVDNQEIIVIINNKRQCKLVFYKHELHYQNEYLQIPIWLFFSCTIR